MLVFLSEERLLTSDRMESVHSAIFRRLKAGKAGRVFISKDFLDLGTRPAVDQAITRLVRSGQLRRVARGLFDRPRFSQLLKVHLAPDVDSVADAVARQTGSRLIPDGATAANRLGLSTQVPAKFSYLTDGRSRQIKVGNVQIDLKHTALRDLPFGAADEYVRVSVAAIHRGRRYRRCCHF
jgi:hypothetical protein